MKRKGVYVLASSLIVVLAIIMLITFGVFSDSADKDSTELTSDVPNAPLVASNSDKPQEDITVHGHWMIEVRNTDGSLVEAHEFDNALLPDGQDTLSLVMGREYSIGGWVIALQSSDAWLTHGIGMIVESSYPGTAEHIFKELTVDVPTEGPNAGKLVLSGTAIALADGNVTRVNTSIVRLAPESAPDSSYTGIPDSMKLFTGTDLASPISLATGQQVLATVVIDFSSS